MRARGWSALFIVLGCSVQKTQEPLAVKQAQIEAPVVEAVPVVEAAPVVADPGGTPVVPEVVPEVVQGPAVPAGGHAVRVRLILGSEPTDGSAPWTRFELAVVDVAGNTVAAATTGRFDAPCSEAPLEAGDLGRWGCWWAGGGWNLRLLKDGEGVVLRSQGRDEGPGKPEKWEDEVWLATPGSAGVVMHARPDLAASEDPGTTPHRPVAQAPTIDVQLQMVTPRGKVQGGATRVTLRVLDGGRVQAMVRSPWVWGKHAPLVPPDPEALASWELDSWEEAGKLRVIEGEGLVALQTRWSGRPGPWVDQARVSLPFGRAAKLIVKK